MRGVFILKMIFATSFNLSSSLIVFYLFSSFFLIIFEYLELVFFFNSKFQIQIESTITFLIHHFSCYYLYYYIDIVAGIGI